MKDVITIVSEYLIDICDMLRANYEEVVKKFVERLVEKGISKEDIDSIVLEAEKMLLEAQDLIRMLSMLKSLYVEYDEFPDAENEIERILKRIKEIIRGLVYSIPEFIQREIENAEKFLSEIR